MSDQPRPWPNVAKEARDRSAEEAVAIARTLDEIERLISDADVLKLVYRASKSATTIIRHLERAGAQTRPE